MVKRFTNGVESEWQRDGARLLCDDSHAPAVFGSAGAAGRVVRRRRGVLRTCGYHPYAVYRPARGGWVIGLAATRDEADRLAKG